MENIPEKKWFNYFSTMRKKYNMRVSANKPLILFLDAKDSSKNHRQLLRSFQNDFFDTTCKTVQTFTERYKCLAICGTDEISFIIEDLNEFIDSINNEKSYRTHDIVSIFSQYFFEEFNKIYEGQTVYFHCKCFSISKEKITSYLKYKSRGILKGVTSIFLKEKGIKNASGIKLVDKLEMCKQYEDYKGIEDYCAGIVYFNGDRINLEEYLNGNIVCIENKKEEALDLELFDDIF